MFRLSAPSRPTVLREDTTDLHRCPFIRSAQRRDTRINPAGAVDKHATALASPQSPRRLGAYAHTPEPPCSPGGCPITPFLGGGGARGHRLQGLRHHATGSGPATGVSGGPTRPAEFKWVRCGSSKPGRRFGGEVACPGLGSDTEWLDLVGRCRVDLRMG